MMGVNATKAAGAYAAQNEVCNKADKPDSRLGRTIGKPELSEQAQKYYDDLKKKFGNYDFILVSRDEKENAKAHAASYANAFKTVVLIDEDKIEKMATDSQYRKKYEDLLSGAANNLSALKAQMEKAGAGVKGYGFTVNDNGTTSFFAVLKKSSADQKARIEKKAELKREERKAEAKKTRKKQQEERIEKAREDKVEQDDSDDYLIISADSIEELMAKIEEYNFNMRSNSIQTEEEKLVGQSIDFRG